MSAASLYPVRPEVAANTLTDEATYKAMYQQSVVNPDGFWREQAKRLDWVKPFTAVKQTSFDDHHVDIKWFADGTLNVSYNCLDRHLAERGDQVAILWEGDDLHRHRLAIPFGDVGAVDPDIVDGAGEVDRAAVVEPRLHGALR